jgi:hypothetical protein
VLRSLILRGAVEQPTIDKHKNMISEAMINALTTYVPKPHKVTVEEYMLCVGEQMRKVSAKNDLDQSITYDPNVFEDSKKIKCFLKTQCKADLATDSYLRYKDHDFKAGQGISAQPKSINLIVGGFVRALEKAIMASFPKYMRMCTGVSTKELRDHTAHILKQHKDKPRMGLALDISQFDTIHGAWSRQFMHFVFDYFGIDKTIYKIMDELNLEWTLDARYVKLQVFERMQSGRADTLLKNTMVALFMNMAFMEVTDPHLILAQGDDVTVIATKIKSKVPDYLSKYLKPEYNLIPPCVGFLLGNELTLDLGRLGTKLGNRNFYAVDPMEQDKKITEYQQAIKDLLALVDTTERRTHCIACNARYYGVNFTVVEAAFEYIYKFANVEPELLKSDFEMSTAFNLKRKKRDNPDLELYEKEPLHFVRTE